MVPGLFGSGKRRDVDMAQDIMYDAWETAPEATAACLYFPVQDILKYYLHGRRHRKTTLHLLQSCMNMHGISYEVVDLKNEFTLLEAACYWVDIPAYPSFDKIPDEKKSEVKLVAEMLLQAGKEGRLKYAKPPEERQYRLPRSIWIAQGRRDLHHDYVGGPEYKIHE